MRRKPQTKNFSLKECVQSEYEECQLFWQWAQHNPVTKEFLIKNCNEGKRQGKELYYLLAIGMRPGLPDYHLPVANAKWRGLWLEMKRRDEKGKKVRDNQLQWRNGLLRIGQCAGFVYGWEHAADVTSRYLRDEI